MPRGVRRDRRFHDLRRLHPPRRHDPARGRDRRLPGPDRTDTGSALAAGDRLFARPELIAVSDSDADGNPEFWYSDPYTWDTGLGVLEVVDDNAVPVLAVCPACSD